MLLGQRHGERPKPALEGVAAVIGQGEPPGQHCTPLETRPDMFSYPSWAPSILVFGSENMML